jgi:membrane protein DedA with SNARE-associated domain
MDNLELMLDAYGLSVIFAVMLIKSIGVPIPIPSDAIMLATAARVAQGRLVFGAAFVAILVALVGGGVIQFGLVRGPARKLMYRYGGYLGLTEARLEAVAQRLRQAGVAGIAVAIFTPGVRSVAVPASGLASTPPRTFAAGLTLGSAAFLLLHFALGYAGGALLQSIGDRVPLPLISGVLVALFVAALGVWVVVRKRQNPGAPTREIVAEAVGAWHDAACPACLALGALGHSHYHNAEHNGTALSYERRK